jgi:hypothetical protein
MRECNKQNIMKKNAGTQAHQSAGLHRGQRHNAAENLELSIHNT